MFGSQERVRAGFANRFEPDGDAYLFRTNLRAAGVRVTAAERDRFVSNYNRGIGIATWGGATAMVVIITAVIVAFVSASADTPQWIIWLTVLACLPVFMAPAYWLWYAPDRALRGRSARTPGRTKEEAREIANERLTWRQLGGAALMIPVSLLMISRSTNLLVGWNRLWLVAEGALAVLLALRALRKWRASR